jgi:hypothetical protein
VVTELSGLVDGPLNMELSKVPKRAFPASLRDAHAMSRIPGAEAPGYFQLQLEIMIDDA